MNRIYEFLISLAVVIVLFAVVALFLPSKRTVEYKIESNRPISTVYDVLNGFNRFDEWNILRSDSMLKSQVSDPASGVGATMSYSSLNRSTGSGTWKLIESVPQEKIKFAIDDSSQGSDKFLTITLDRTGPLNKNVEIRQVYEVDYGWNLFGRFAGMYVERNVGDKIKAGSKRLTTFLATIPKLSYADRVSPITFTEVPATNALVATVISKRDNNEIAIGIIMNKLAERNILTVTEKQAHVHVSGHPGQPELAALYDWIRPEILVPVHGERRHMAEQARFARAHGVPKAVVQSNGDVVRLAPGEPKTIGKERTGRLILDGDTIIAADGATLNERRRLSWYGLISVAFALGANDKLLGSPEIRLHGVPIEEDLDDFIDEATTAAVKAIKDNRGDYEKLRETVRLAVRRVAVSWTGKKPIVDVMILETA